VKLKRDVLYRSAEPVERGEDLYWLATGMLETMQAENGVGLAAPQVGESLRLIVGGREQLGWSFAIINPVITKRSSQIYRSREGCLSFPGEIVVVERHKIVTVEGFDLNWRPVKIRRARDLLGACLQHEIDHLDGVCILPESWGG